MKLFRKRIRDKPREKRSSELDDFIKGADADMGEEWQVEFMLMKTGQCKHHV